MDMPVYPNEKYAAVGSHALLVCLRDSTVAWSISNGSSGTYTLPSGSSTEFDGFYLVAGRYQSGVKLDNISVTSAPVSLSSYTFQEPGTLTIQSTLSNSYLAPSSASFTVAAPYVIAYESADYSTINAASAYNQMGNSWSTSTYNSRWANWNRNYTYTFVNNNVNSSSQRMYVDNDQILWVDFKGGSYPLALVQGYGVGQNKPATFRAEGLEDANTYVKLRYDVSYGNHITTTSFLQAEDDGTFAYTLPTNGTLQKCIIYMPQGSSLAKPRTIFEEEEVATGIAAYDADADVKAQDVYSLSGVLIRSKATDMNGLPRGIYIVAGKRVMVK